MSKRIGGIFNITVDGQGFSIRGQWTFGEERVNREAVAGQDRPHGFVETKSVASFKGSMDLPLGLTLERLQIATTAQVSFVNGKTYVLRKFEASKLSEDARYTKIGVVATSFEEF